MGQSSCRGEDYLSTMPMPIPVPEIVERAWRDAPPGREAAFQNETLRELQRLLQPRVPPRWCARRAKKKPGAEAGLVHCSEQRCS